MTMSNKPGISTSLVMIRENPEHPNGIHEIDLPDVTIHDNVSITPSYMKFENPIEGITLRECLTIRNVGKKIALIRVHEPNSIALKVKTVKRGTILSPGLALKRWVSYSFKRPALLHALIPIEINGYRIDYRIVCVFNVEYIEIAPKSVDFGIVDIGCSSGMRLLTISNTGGKSTRFTIDLGKNDMDINVKPHRGVVRPRSSVQLHVRMIGINEGTFFNEFWIKSTPNICVPVKAKIIIPRLEIEYPHSTGDFTLVDFSSTFFGVRKYDTLTLNNMSSQFSSFVVLAEIANQLIPIRELDISVHPEFGAFEISPVEGRLESFHNIEFHLTFNPRMNMIPTKQDNRSIQDFMIFIRIVRVHCTEVEDILRAEKRAEPKPDDPPFHKVHIQEGSIFSTDSFGSSISFVHGRSELVRLCLHGEAEFVQLRFVPNELYFEICTLDELTSRVIEIHNLSSKSPVTVSFVDSGIATCSPSEILAGPLRCVGVSLDITRKRIHSECSFNLNFNVLVDTADSHGENVQMNIATYVVKCSLVMSITNITKHKIDRIKFGAMKNYEFLRHFCEIETCRPLTLESLGLTESNKLQQSMESIGTTTMPLTPLQIYRIKVSPTMFICGSVAQRMPSYQELIFENQNNFPVMIRLASLSPKNIRFMSGDRMILQPDQSITKHVEFRGDQIGKFNSYIDYVINNHHTYELALTADVNYKYLTLSTREIMLGSDFLSQESYQPIQSYVELRNKLNALTHFKWDVPTTASYVINPSIGAVRGKRSLWMSIMHVPDFMKSDQAEVVVICESGHQMTLRLNKNLPSLKVAFLNNIVDVGEIGLNIPFESKSVLHNAGNTGVLFQVESTDLPHGCNVHPRRGIISPHSIIILTITLQFRVCMQFTIDINVKIQKTKNLMLKMKGEVSFPKVKFTPNEIDIGRIGVQSYQIFGLSVVNNGNTPIKLQFPIDDFPEFRVAKVATRCNDSIQEIITILIPPRETRLFYLHFQPVNLANYKIYLPIVINDILGPIIHGNPVSSQSTNFSLRDEGCGNNFREVKIIDIPKVIPNIHIYGTVIGQILSFNRLHFIFDAQQKTFGHILKIVNISTLNMPFTIHVRKLFPSDAAFTIEWESGTETLPDISIESIACYLPSGSEVVFQISYEPTAEEFSTGDITVSALGEFGARMFNVIHLEGKNLKPSIVSDVSEIYFAPSPPLVESAQIFYLTLNNFPGKTGLLTYVEEPSKYSGIFTKNILSISFPSGNVSLINKDTTKVEICLSLRSKYSVSFQTRISISDDNRDVISYITVYGTIDNCLLTIHSYPIVSNKNFEVDKGRQIDTNQSSWSSLHSETSDNESTIDMNCNSFHIIESQPRLSTQSIMSNMSKSRKFPSTSKLKSSVTDDDMEDEVGIPVDHESILSASSPETVKADEQQFANQLFPADSRMLYEQHMRRMFIAAENWMYSDPFKFQFNPDICCGLTAVLSGLCSSTRATNDRHNGRTIDKSFLNILLELCGQEIYHEIDIAVSLPVDKDERIKLVLKTYGNMLSFLLKQNAYVSHITPEFLLNYDDYCAVEVMNTLSKSSFEARSEQCWLDVILQTYKQFVLSKIKINCTVESVNDHAHHQSVEIIRTISSTSCSQFFPEYEKNAITRKAREKEHYEAEALLLAWLEYHYEQQYTRSWLNTRVKLVNSIEGRMKLRVRSVNNFDHDLMDSLVLIAVTASYCPYLIDEYFGNIFVRPETPEEYFQNAISIVRAWQRIRLGFIIAPQDIIHPNPVQMLMLIVRLFQTLPTYSARDKVKFSCSLTGDVIRHICLTNTSDAPVSLVAEFFGNSGGFFSIVDSGSIFNLNSHDSRKIKIKYHARKIKKVYAHLVLCGSAIGPNFTKNYCFVLEGHTNNIRSSAEYEISTEMYSTVDKTITVKVPYTFEADYDIWITEKLYTKPSSLTMTRWSDLRKKKVPRRLYINQKTLAVLENAHKANLSITVGCISPHTRNFWLIFQAKNGDFVIRIISTTRSSLTGCIDVKWKREKCICIIPKILDTCPLNFDMKIPSRNVQLWNCVNSMFQKCLNPREHTFWTEQLNTNIGIKLIQWMSNSAGDDNVKDFLYIFCENVKYKVVVSENKNDVRFPDSFIIPDVINLHKNTDMRIHLSETLPDLYTIGMTLVSCDEMEHRNYHITFSCENSK